MNGYFIATSITVAELVPGKTGGRAPAGMVQAWSSRGTMLFVAETPEAAQILVDESLAAQTTGDHPREIKVHEMVIAQVVGELLTEAGNVPLDWPEIARQSRVDLETTPEGFFEQGYWLDIREVKRASPMLESMRQNLPEETRSGLNWRAETQFYFILSVLSTPVSSTELVEEPHEKPEPPPPPAEEPAGAEGESAGEAPADDLTFERFLETDDYPRLNPLETAVIVRARNAAVATWLWHQYAADTRLAGNAVCLEAWCGVGGVDIEESDAKTTV